MSSKVHLVKSKHQDEEKFTSFHIIIIVLSVYVLVSLLADLFFSLPHETSKLLLYIDYGICAFFFIDFCLGLYNAHNKLKYMKWGWIDLLASIPFIEFAIYGRVLRLIRLIRIVRSFKSIHNFIHKVFKSRAEGAFIMVSLIAILLVIFSSIAILYFENTEEANIKTAEDAIWWSYVTITTVGYGDKYPVTTGGRIVGILLITGGVGVFGTFTAFVASWFVRDKKHTRSKQE